MNNFVRGQDPKETMGIGQDAILKEIGGIILREDTENWNHVRRDITIEKWDKIGLSESKEELKATQYDLKNKNVIIGVSRGKYTLLKIRFKYDGPQEGEEKDLINTLLKIREAFRNWDQNDFFFPLIKNIAAKTIGFDLVSVQPMSGPIGKVAYLDYKYKRPNKIWRFVKRIFNKIFPAKPHKKPNI
jgi:hypothetical protein